VLDITGFGDRQFSPHIWSSKRIKASRPLLQDQPRTQAWAGYALGERIGRVQGQYMTVGSGQRGPIGIFNAAQVGVTTASPTAILIDEVLALVASVNAAYRAAAKFMMHSQIWLNLAQQKNGDGVYLWKLAGLDQWPVVFNDYAPSTITAGNRTVLFGDLSKYVIWDQNEVDVQAFEELYAERMEVGLEAFHCCDAALCDATGAAVRVLQQAAS
jgi:HK97 family phage major capsid protein